MSKIVNNSSKIIISMLSYFMVMKMLNILISVIMIYIIMGVIAFIIYMINTTNRKENNNNKVEENKNNYNKFYRPKRYLITLNELKFYNILMEIAKELDLVLFSQVSLYNIIEMQKNLDYKTRTIYFNKIASKSIDFVLVDKKDCRIKLCIELDDKTHNQVKRIDRDLFINQLFKELEINLLRYPTYNVYYKETLKNQIVAKMQEHYYIN